VNVANSSHHIRETSFRNKQDKYQERGNSGARLQIFRSAVQRTQIMCGIVGVLGFNGEKVSPELLQRMVGSLRHRGPDSSGVYSSDTSGVGLAHARLSIIDLSGGQQPMANSDGSLWVTFNGEIFNYIELRDELVEAGHRFKTRSDTEVILHMYEEKGEDCVRYFNGQWAFAIWDAKRRRLFLSRDRVGVRPLFYTRTAKNFVFASELKSILSYPDVDRTLDLAALDQLFTFWCTLPPRTIRLPSAW